MTPAPGAIAAPEQAHGCPETHQRFTCCACRFWVRLSGNYSTWVSNTPKYHAVAFNARQSCNGTMIRKHAYPNIPPKVFMASTACASYRGFAVPSPSGLLGGSAASISDGIRSNPRNVSCSLRWSTFS
ncbi:hypothetical protein VTN00DRAFT_5378 [Thermoascus crustaceus]|uniref:uncharacterized protein n=1 Tax=Thermoascus crustaceus TaxID=5088 RepID=UPI003742A7D7